MSVTTDVVIYHNPACGTSRKMLGLIRNCGVEPHIVEPLDWGISREREIMGAGGQL
jgi:arsenate reductase